MCGYKGGKKVTNPYKPFFKDFYAITFSVLSARLNVEFLAYFKIIIKN